MLSTQLCVCAFFALFAALSISTIDAKSYAESAQNYRTICVDQSGSKGCLKTIQAAIDSVPSNNKDWIRIQVKKGVYREQVKIPKDKPFIYLEGDGEKLTQLTWDAHERLATCTFSTLSDYTIVKGIGFINSYNHPFNPTKNPRMPAVAALVKGDKCAFFQCGFYGVQDTLWDAEGRHYFKECTIEGAVDFIFGNGQSHYEGCKISAIGETLGKITGYVTAQGREREEESTGFVFKNCNLDGNGKAYLGRAWREHARVLFYNTYLGKPIVPKGWEPWHGLGHENQLTFAENNCRGPGSDTSKRVGWEKKMSVEQVKQLTSISFIDNEGWINKLPSDFFLGYK